MIIDLPVPPTLNTIWRRTGARFHPSAAYERWKREADGCFMAQRLKVRTIDGNFAVDVGLDRKRTRADLDNVGTKALLDWCQSRELIRNDRNCVAISVRWVSSVDAPQGCRITLSSAEKSRA